MVKKGFTLIELLVVATIIATLLGVASVSYIRATQSSRDARRKTDLEQIRQALEIYRSENGVYPLGATATVSTAESSFTSVMSPSFITTVPSDPKASSNYNYVYTKTSNLQYALCAQLEVDPGLTLSYCGTQGCGSATGNCNYEVTNP